MLAIQRNERNFEKDLLNSLFNGYFLDDVFYTNTGIMKTDVEEKDGELIVSVNMPGVKKENLNIDFENGYLTIEVNNKEKKEKDDKKYVVKERTSFNCKRTYYLGDDIDSESIKASLNDGVLEVSLKKTEKQIRNIVIE